MAAWKSSLKTQLKKNSWKTQLKNSWKTQLVFAAVKWQDTTRWRCQQSNQFEQKTITNNYACYLKNEV